MAGTFTKTRIMIISDTHSASLWPKESTSAFREGIPDVDVLLHCGDMTEEGLIEAYEKTFEMMSQIKAELKLVIAGNHDVSLDAEYYTTMGQKVHGSRYRPGMPQEALRMFKGRKALRAGVTYLQEGTHKFRLKSGATFTVYASPYQRELCNWAFPYRGDEDRFNPKEHTTKYAKSIAQNHIPDFPSIDIMMTHGPPLGHLVRMPNDAYLGCRHLQRAAARAMPRLHCFGHIHEGRGAERVTWTGKKPDYDTDSSVKNVESIERDTSEPGKPEEPSFIDVSAGSKGPLQHGRETLMVNAAIMNGDNNPSFAPWIVDIHSPYVDK